MSGSARHVLAQPTWPAARQGLREPTLRTRDRLPRHPSCLGYASSAAAIGMSLLNAKAQSMKQVVALYGPCSPLSRSRREAQWRDVLRRSRAEGRLRGKTNREDHGLSETSSRAGTPSTQARPRGRCLGSSRFVSHSRNAVFTRKAALWSPVSYSLRLHASRIPPR